MTDDSPDDRRGVRHAASVLDVSEYDIFDLAYRYWFGRLPVATELRAEFSRYLNGKIVPPWVRDFCRRADTLNHEQRSALGLDPAQDRPALAPLFPVTHNKWVSAWFRLDLRTREVIIGGLALIGMAAAVAALIYLAAATQHTVPLRCTLPPCY